MKGKIFNKWCFLPISSLLLLTIYHDTQFQPLLLRITLYGFFIFYLRYMLYKELVDQKKFNCKDFSSLYGWSDFLDGGHAFINELLEKHPVENDILSNLQAIKNKILSHCNHDIRKLRLLEAYFKVLKDDKEKEFYYKSVIGVIVSIGIFLLRQILLVSNIPETLSNLISNIYFYDFLFFLFILFAYMSNVIHLGNRRIKIFQELITQCIEEKK